MNSIGDTIQNDNLRKADNLYFLSFVNSGYSVST